MDESTPQRRINDGGGADRSNGAPDSARDRAMPRIGHRVRSGARVLVFGVLGVLAQIAHADFELTTPDGRQVVLQDDGTWHYRQEPSKDKSAAPGDKPQGEAVLRLERKIDRGSVCSVVLSLRNQMPFEIRSIVPSLSAYRANGVVFETVSVAFLTIRPGGVQESGADFSGISCQDIARIQVLGADRCELGELTKFSDAKGECLARVRVVASDLLRFDK